MRRYGSFAVWLCLAWLTGHPAWAGKFNRVLTPGDKAPDFSGLPDTDGESRGLSDFDQADFIVLVFTANHCPVAQAYQRRLIDLQDDMAESGVQLVAISCSLDKGDSPSAMKDRAREEGYNFPYLHDAPQQSGKDYGASHTPTVFVLDRDRRVRYMGAIDDSWRDEKKVKRAYLQEALAALLAGDEPPSEETRPHGCLIDYKKAPPDKPTAGALQPGTHAPPEEAP